VRGSLAEDAAVRLHWIDIISSPAQTVAEIRSGVVVGTVY